MQWSHWFLKNRDVGYGTNGNGAAKTNGNGARTNGAAKTNGYGNGAPKTSNGNGYPKENPANPLKLDGAAATNVEVRADSTTTAAPMMMGGEVKFESTSVNLWFITCKIGI